jgi:hypothetical protein
MVGAERFRWLLNTSNNTAADKTVRTTKNTSLLTQRPSGSLAAGFRCYRSLYSLGAYLVILPLAYRLEHTSGFGAN